MKDENVMSIEQQIRKNETDISLINREILEMENLANHVDNLNYKIQETFNYLMNSLGHLDIKHELLSNIDEFNKYKSDFVRKSHDIVEQNKVDKRSLENEVENLYFEKLKIINMEGDDGCEY
ncbi:hypothetical protein [Macrococcus armenti]|uniref:hypothetical protein n=1 Tax=Macrococcus armenti TaxID=2875764 RepID=UPI001CCB5649|nr:hypothetical protein [Macrococcus armenti]UBH15626.1 hypothetical protein LAU44_01330 [Macrococcus armenti]UBH17987.1 hypothetical protein LAU39_01335 [Macrococcus armenti]UBH20252.1 hypothetical protein LAU40_01330 [Macrococcus armenti]